VFSEAPTSATPQIRQNHCFFAGKLPYFRSFGVGGPWAAPSPAGGPSRLTPDFPTNQFSDFLFLGPCNVLPNPPQNNHFHSFTMASHATFCQPPLRTTISTASLWLLMQLFANPPSEQPFPQLHYGFSCNFMPNPPSRSLISLLFLLSFYRNVD